ncbi:uncharacterized protein BJX67DRAFT_228759 [Aspergillus lucknowensis]|uniref:DUF1254-domain-containing protein n=1 Tax=Aspergillus lucknowensis TaxID=176173 RepID=A0ABR4LHV8_9EURO
MYHTLWATVALATLGVASGGSHDPANLTAEEATEFALIYGFPLTPFTTYAFTAFAAAGATNTFAHARELSTVHDKTIVRPNADTLYSTVLIDLSENDLILDVSAIEDRYWVFPFYDVYSNNYANIGSVEGSPPGRYLIRYGPAVRQEPGVQLCYLATLKSECQHGIVGLVNSPTPYGLVLPRILLKNNGTGLEAVHEIQDEMSVKLVNRESRHAPPLTVAMLNSSLPEDPITRALQLTARIAPYNPPREISDFHRVKTTLTAAGIWDGRYHQRVRNLTAVAAAAQASVTTAVNQPENIMSLENNWIQLTPEAQGDFGTNYEMRAFVAGWGYLALRASESLYPMYTPGGEVGGRFSLGPDEAYLFTFSTKPPLNDKGFWSLTAYGPDLYLIPNELDRYSLGDRSNLTYSDGQPIYDGGDRDESFQIVVQPADVVPPGNWTSNWLPAPTGGGDFDVTLRFYAPSDELSNGGWTFPKVEKITALKA